MNYILGLDLGTSGLKGIVVNHKGEIVGGHSQSYPINMPHSGYCEQNPQDWIIAAKHVIHEFTTKIADFSEKLEGISFSGQMHSLVLLDAEHEIIRPAILWNDMRTTPQCKRIMEFAGQHVLHLTKNTAIEGFTFTKLLWVKENEPELFRKIEKFLLPKDFLAFWLTGHLCTDISDASGTMLIDIEKRTWAWPLIRKFDLPAKIFPELVESIDFVGTVRSNVAELLGIRSTVKVFAGGADNACAAVGAGITSIDSGLVSIGTSGVFSSYESSNTPNYDGKLHFMCHAFPGKNYSMGVAVAAGQSLSWYKNTFAKMDTFEELLKGINQINPGSEGLLFAPYIMGDRTPHLDSEIRGSFIGIDARHTKDHFSRAVLEGITFSLKESQLIMKETAQKDFRKIISIGGGAKNQYWLQMQADIFDSEVASLAVEEGPSYGAAMIAAVGCGWFANLEECVASFVRYQESYFPDPSRVKFYQDYFKIYQKIYHQTKMITRELREANSATEN